MRWQPVLLTRRKAKECKAMSVNFRPAICIVPQIAFAGCRAWALPSVPGSKTDHAQCIGHRHQAEGDDCILLLKYMATCIKGTSITTMLRKKALQRSTNAIQAAAGFWTAQQVVWEFCLCSCWPSCLQLSNAAYCAPMLCVQQCCTAGCQKLSRTAFCSLAAKRARAFLPMIANCSSGVAAD